METLLADVRDTSLKIQSNGPITMDHGDFPDMENIDSFTLYKGFTLFEIVNELRNPNPRKKAHQIQKEMQQQSTGFISNHLPVSLKELMMKICKKSIKSITEDELEAVSTAAEYMLGKDDYKAAEEG